jgi:PAS domain S-box-containing protein
LESISDAFYAVDKDWKFTYFNKEAERLLQRNEKEVLGKNLWEVFPTVVGTSLDKVYHSIAKNFEPDTFEFLYPADSKWYEITAYPSAGGLSVYFKNIDERKIAAEKLQKAFEEKNKILESIGDAFFTVNNDWIVTYWNKEAELVLGRKKEVIVGRNLWDEYADGIDSKSYNEYHRAIATREAVYFETFYKTLNMWLEVSAYPSEDGLSVYFKDITLRKTVDIRLQEANERFEKVTEATKDAIWDWDIVNHTFYRSKAVERFFGKNASKSLDENDLWNDKFHPEDLAKIQESIYEAIGNPECSRWELQYRIFNEQGELIYVVDRGLIIRNKEGTAVRMVGAMANISETLHHINTIEMQNTKLKNIAWTQSHVVRAPISRILGIINLIEEEGENFNEIQFWLKQLKISTVEMDNIIKNIVKETIRFEKE